MLALLMMSGLAAMLCQRHVAALEAKGIELEAEAVRVMIGYGLGANLVIGAVLILVMQWLFQRQVAGWNSAERQRAEERLQASMREKDILLEEMHHRVKNNLQVVSSLLNLQAAGLHDPRDQELFRESQNRIKSMALVHEGLYPSDNMAQVNFGKYLNQWMADVYRSYGVSDSDITLRMDVDPGIRMSMETAIPCGLIVNELVSNALKHAFPSAADRRPAAIKEPFRPRGEIRVSLKPDGADHLVLRVTDTGVGLPPAFNMDGLTSLGLKLVATLTAQVQGALTWKCNGGTVWCIHLPTYMT